MYIRKNVIVGLLFSMEHVIASVFSFISPPSNTRSYYTVDVDAVDFVSCNVCLVSEYWLVLGEF